MNVAAGWIEGSWIYSQYPEQHALYWIENGHIWGPDGADDMDTGFWTNGHWIYGPRGAENLDTGFYIEKGWIYGPRPRFPFAR